VSAADGLLLMGSARTVLLVDWPSPDVPDTLVALGYDVVVKSGPGEVDYAVRELRDGAVVVRPLGRRPERADLVFCHRPLEELPAVVALARSLGAGAVWYQSGVAPGGERDPAGCWLAPEAAASARGLVEAAGLRYVGDAYIADAARRLGPRLSRA